MLLRPWFAVVLLAFVTAKTVVVGQNLSLIHVHVISRGGFSKPLVTMEGDPNNELWSSVPHGYLTLNGKSATYESGRQLRNQYAEFLSERANDDETYVRSTDTNRGLTSAELLMAGLYPPTHSTEIWSPDIGSRWQPTPVHTLPISGDQFSADYPFKYCLKFLQLATIFSKTPEAQREYQKVESLREELQANGTFTWNNFIGFLSFGDIIDRQVALGVTFPDWLEPHVPQVLSTYRYFVVNLVEIPELRKLAAGPLIYEIMSRVQQIARRKTVSSKKMFVYMTHAYPLMYIMSSMYMFDKKIPPADAKLLLEMYHDLDSPNKYYLRALYKNETSVPAYPLKLPGCPNSELCSWKIVHRKVERNFVKDGPRRCRPYVFVDQWNTQMKFNARHP